MENVLTRLFQLPILPCTIAIANVRKFLHMEATVVTFALLENRLMDNQQ